MYAIVRSGGKQYRVEEGRSVVVERLTAEEGETVELKDVLMIAENGSVTIGEPVIEGARVVAEVEAHGRHKKIIVFKYKAKVRTRKKTGHRQPFTQLAVREILAPGQEPKAAKPKRRRAAKAAAEAEKPPAAEAEAAPPEAAAPTDAPPAEAAPKRRTRKATPATGTAKPARKRTPKATTGEEKPKPARRTRKAAPKADEKPKRRTPRKKAGE